MVYIDSKHLELEDRVVAINHAIKVVKGGRRLHFIALAVVGDKNGHVGLGTSKVQEVPEAIHKTIGGAKRNLVEVPMIGSIIPHEVIDAFSDGRILMKPAVKGSGVVAGGPVRVVLELARITDITSKSLGSNTPTNVVRATVEGLRQLKHAGEVAEPCDKSTEELIGQGGQ